MSVIATDVAEVTVLIFIVNMAVEPENLITAVEERPLLWDTKNDDYKDKNKKDAAWIDVCSCLLEEFAEKPEPEQKVLLQDVKSKWRTVRDNYIRTLKKQAEYNQGVGQKKVKTYIYGKQLAFLKIRFKDTSETETEIKKEKDSTPHRAIVRKRIAKKRKRTVENSELMHVKLRRNTTEMDEDVAFFYSLLPTIRTLNVDQKFTFRLQTMQFLQNLKNSSTSKQVADSNSHPQTSVSSSEDDETSVFAPEVQIT